MSHQDKDRLTVSEPHHQALKRALDPEWKLAPGVLFEGSEAN